MCFMRVHHVTQIKVALRRVAPRKAALVIVVMTTVARLGLLVVVLADTSVQVLQLRSGWPLGRRT